MPNILLSKVKEIGKKRSFPILKIEENKSRANTVSFKNILVLPGFIRDCIRETDVTQHAWKMLG